MVTKVPRIGSRHKLGPLYDWLDTNVGAPVVSGPTVQKGTADGQMLVWDSASQSWLANGFKQTISYQISETDLIANTTQHLILNPGEGYTNSISFFMTAVQKTITTGGIIKMQIGGVDVAGATATIANGASPGSHQVKFASSAPSRNFGFGDDVTLVLSGFAGAGALNVFITTSDSP